MYKTNQKNWQDLKNLVAVLFKRHKSVENKVISKNVWNARVRAEFEVLCQLESKN